LGGGGGRGRNHQLYGKIITGVKKGGGEPKFSLKKKKQPELEGGACKEKIQCGAINRRCKR